MTGKDIFLIAAAGLCVAGGWAHYFSARSLAGAPLPRAMVAVRDSQPVATPPIPPTVDHPLAPAPVSASNTFASLLVADPEDQDARAATLLLNLCHAGQFAAAFDLIGQAPAGLQAGFYRIVFKCWAQSQPQQALQSLAAIADPQARSAAWRAAADGWNVNDPAGLAACAFSLPAGGDRDYALGQALGNWSLQDPAALATWLNTLPRGPEFDSGVALLLSRSDSANRPPELAMEWVEEIGDPALRQNSLEQVVTEWAQTDAASAHNYVATAPWLQDALRTDLLSRLPVAP